MSLLTIDLRMDDGVDVDVVIDDVYAELGF